MEENSKSLEQQIILHKLRHSISMRAQPEMTSSWDFTPL